jgi:predicted PurR-regulated permease PerM
MRLPLPGRTRGPSDPADDDARARRGPRPDPSSEPTTAPAPTPTRGPRLRSAVRMLAIGAAQFLLIVGAVVVLGYVLGKLWSILLPVILGLLFATVLWPPTRFLRRHRWPPALAAAVVLVGFLAVIGGIIAWLAPSVVGQAGQLADSTGAALDHVQKWLTGPPFNLGRDQIGQAVDSAIGSLQHNVSSIAGYALTGAGVIGNSLINLVLALVLAFFFIKDGPKWVPWLAAQTSSRVAPHVAALSQRTWDTLSEFIRQQAFVGFIDALFIGLGLLILGVPLVLPLAVLTFFGAFVPIIGAFVAGAFAVLIALVSNGFTTALIVLGVVVLVQQLEGNVLQPIIQGRGFNLHAAVVILAVTAGGSLAGIIGAFLGVPVAALIAVVYRYVRDVLDGRPPEVDTDGTRPQVTGDETGADITREQVAAPETAPTPDGGPPH